MEGIAASDYTMEDSDGAPVTASGGGLDLCGDDRYMMNVTHRDESGQRVAVASSGNYGWDGVMLILMDSGDLAPLTASVTGGVIVVQLDAHEYSFIKLIQLPPFTPPDCGPLAARSGVSQPSAMAGG